MPPYIVTGAGGERGEHGRNPRRAGVAGAQPCRADRRLRRHHRGHPPAAAPPARRPAPGAAVPHAAAYVEAVEELARHDGSVAWCVSIANSTALIAPYLSPEAAYKIFGPPRAVVAWGPPNEATAQAVPGGYRISGRWGFASGCRHATWMGAHGRVIEPDGSFRLTPSGRPAVLTWLFPVAAARRLDTWDTIGLRGTASDEYEVEDL